ncbi:MAG: RNA polymerase sigma-70 factor [Arcicella sp.]|jgi:RNA polymerase sigma-70 factor (ECF subfamily)|nr:RNA polymerase sigma-70 factor [Arcicella sp.]
MQILVFSDDELISLLSTEKGSIAFDEIYERYWEKLLRMAIFKTNHKEAAEEIVQELFTSLWEKRRNVVINNLENYLFVALKYLIINYLKAKIKDTNLIDSEGLEIASNLHESMTAEALQSAIKKAVSLLPDKTQVIFHLSRFEEKSHKEIASELDISEKSVEYHITQALKFLRLQLRDYLN